MKKNTNSNKDRFQLPVSDTVFYHFFKNTMYSKHNRYHLELIYAEQVASEENLNFEYETIEDDGDFIKLSK